MRLLLLLLLATPFLADAQINRSDNEEPQSITKDYIVKKVFRNKEYKPVWYSPLRERINKNEGTSWVIEHRFEISDKQPSSFDKGTSKKEYSFIFFFDKRMNILRAESYNIID